LKSGVDINSRKHLAFTPLACVARINRADMVRVLLDQGADVDARSINGRTALMEAVRFDGSDMGARLETLRFLINSGADMEIKDEDGKTALFHACGVSNYHDAGIDVATLLIRAGADVNAFDNSNFTVLMNAFDHCADRTTRLLIEHGAVDESISYENS
jgi:ankyrin repeat protein